HLARLDREPLRLRVARDLRDHRHEEVVAVAPDPLDRWSEGALPFDAAPEERREEPGLPEGAELHPLDRALGEGDETEVAEVRALADALDHRDPEPRLERALAAVLDLDAQPEEIAVVLEAEALAHHHV